MTGAPQPPTEADAVVVGGGFYGAHIAAFLARRLGRVVLLERESTLLTRASYNNQARVHGGYHYPRSILTSLRSRRNYPRFVREYAAAIDATFTSLYAISRLHSKVTAAQFVEFCRRIEAPLRPAEPAVQAQFDADLVEAVFAVEETAFDARALADGVTRTLATTGVAVCRGVAALALEPGRTHRLRVRWGEAAGAAIDAPWVFLCAYSATNELLEASRLPVVPLVHELAEIVIVTPPERLRGVGVTLMDGPFWSSMPFPALNSHSLSHVRYTPHARWADHGAPGVVQRSDEVRRHPPSSHAPHMLRDAARYLPAMVGARYLQSLWEVKTILPRSEVDDSRPILARPVEGAPGAVTVLGAKIDNVYDVEQAITELLESEGYP